MTNKKKLKNTVSVLWLVGMAGMVVTAPLWIPCAIVQKLKSK